MPERVKQKTDRGVFSDSFLTELARQLALQLAPLLAEALSKNGASSTGGLLDRKAAAKYLSFSMTMLKVMIAHGELPEVRRGKKRMIAKDDLDRWIAAHKEDEL